MIKLGHSTNIIQSKVHTEHYFIFKTKKSLWLPIFFVNNRCIKDGLSQRVPSVNNG